MNLTRRELLATTAVLAACARKGPAPERHVSIVRAASYSIDLVPIVRDILLRHRVNARGKRVVLKPNLVEFAPDAAINTSPVFVSAVREAFLAQGAAEVRIAEGPGHRRVTLDLADAAGYFGAVKNFEDHFTDLNLDEVRSTPLPHPASNLNSLYLPRTVLDCDLLVSLPKMKTHHWAGATLSMKNLFGVVPGAVYGWPKNVLHWAGIPESIAALSAAFPNAFTIVDGIEGMEGNGPIHGARKHVCVIVAGGHLPSVDATCCRIMRLDPERIEYLNLAARHSDWNQAQVCQIGETIASVATAFKTAPGFETLRL